MTGPSPSNLLDYTGRRVVITGAASGIGAATTALLVERGAEVHALDVAPVVAEVATHHCDLSDPEAILATADRLPDRIDVVMSCAGLPNGGRFEPEMVLRVNWLGLRLLTETLLPRLPEGGAVVHIASTAGRDWPERSAELAQLMATTSFDDGLRWLRERPGLWGDGYAFSKEAVQYYTMWRAVQLLPAGVRMNSLCPGVTATGLVEDFRRGVGEDVIDRATAVAGRMAEPAEMAPAMLFLGDHAASSYLNGVNLNLDRGTGAARATGQFDPELIWGPAPG